MTIYAVCAVKDSAMNAFAQPLFVPQPAMAVRSFTNEVNRADANNQLYTNSSDFELFHIAQYDDETGAFGPAGESGPVRLVRAVDVKTPA